MTGRTNTVKDLEEGSLYGVIANVDEHKFGVTKIVKVTGAALCSVSNGDENSLFAAISAEVVGYVRLVTPYAGDGVNMTLTIDSDVITIPHGTPSGRGFAITGGKDLTATPTVASSIVGTILEIVYVPIFVAATDSIDYVTDFGRTHPDEYLSIYNRGKFMHRKRIHNVERTLSFTSSFLSYEHIMHKFANLECTLCFERTDDAGATVSEREYYGKVFFKEPDVSGSGGDTNSTSTTAARYERWMTIETT